MAETILVIAKILGVLFIMCKVINKLAQVSDPNEVINLIGDSLSMRTGSFTFKRKD